MSDDLSKVDWTRPIEMVDVTGDAVPATVVDGPNLRDEYRVDVAGCSALVVRSTGEFFGLGWRIRNVAEPVQADMGNPITDDIAKRMEALVRRMGNERDYPCQIVDWRNEARAIVALLPEPVDADLVEAKRLNDDSPYDLTGLSREHAVRNVRHIEKTILAAIKLGRKLEREA